MTSIGGPRELENKRGLLLITQSDESRNSLTQLLKSLASEVIPTGSDLKALEQPGSRQSIGMILLEATMPMTKSIGLIRIIRQRLGHQPAIFILSDGTDPKFDEAYFEGTDAIFVKPISPDELKAGVSSVYAETVESSTYHRLHKRKRVCRARVSFENDWLKAKGFAMNFSVGGMFVGSMDELPARGQKISFTLLFNDGQGTGLSGYATVKWNRPEMKFGRPRGFGAEFLGLDNASLAKLREIIESA